MKLILESLVLVKQLLDASELRFSALSLRPLLGHNAAQCLELELWNALPERLPQLLVEIVLLAHEQVDDETQGANQSSSNGQLKTNSILYCVSFHKS